MLVSQCVYGGTHSDIYYIPEPGNGKKARYTKPPDAVLLLPPGLEKIKMNLLVYEKIYEGLTNLLEQQEIYCNPGLRLDDLADKLNTNKTYVSQVINESFHTNFYTLINRYRIRKAIELMENTKLQIKDVWIQSGFNSQSVFNAMFKKEMEVTPSEWMKNANNRI